MTNKDEYGAKLAAGEHDTTAVRLARQAARWEVVPSEDGCDDTWGIRREGEDRGMSIAQMVWEWDAQRIVTAVNCHDDLLQLARLVFEHFRDTDAPLGQRAAAAVAKAEAR